MSEAGVSLQLQDASIIVSTLAISLVLCWIAFRYTFFAEYDINRTSVQLVASATASFSVDLLVLAVFEVLGITDAWFRFNTWRWLLIILAVDLIVVVPFFLNFTLALDLGFGKRTAFPTAFIATSAFVFLFYWLGNIFPVVTGGEHDIYSVEGAVGRLGVVGAATSALLSGYGAVSGPAMYLQGWCTRPVKDRLLTKVKKEARDRLADVVRARAKASRANIARHGLRLRLLPASASLGVGAGGRGSVPGRSSLGGTSMDGSARTSLGGSSYAKDTDGRNSSVALGLVVVPDGDSSLGASSPRLTPAQDTPLGHFPAGSPPVPLSAVLTSPEQAVMRDTPGTAWSHDTRAPVNAALAYGGSVGQRTVSKPSAGRPTAGRSSFGKAKADDDGPGGWLGPITGIVQKLASVAGFEPSPSKSSVSSTATGRTSLGRQSLGSAEGDLSADQLALLDKSERSYRKLKREAKGHQQVHGDTFVVYADILSARQFQDNRRSWKTLAFTIAGIVLALWTAWRLFQAVRLLWHRELRRLDDPDPITRSFQFLEPVLLWLRVPPQTAHLWIQPISSLLVGGQVITSVRGFFLQFSRLLSYITGWLTWASQGLGLGAGNGQGQGLWYSIFGWWWGTGGKDNDDDGAPGKPSNISSSRAPRRSAGHAAVVLFLSQVTGLYFTYTLLSLRQAVPSARRGAIDKAVGQVHFQELFNLSDGIFLVSCMLTAVLQLLNSPWVSQLMSDVDVGDSGSGSSGGGSYDSAAGRGYGYSKDGSGSGGQGGVGMGMGSLPREAGMAIWDTKRAKGRAASTATAGGLQDVDGTAYEGGQGAEGRVRRYARAVPEERPQAQLPFGQWARQTEQRPGRDDGIDSLGTAVSSKPSGLWGPGPVSAAGLRAVGTDSSNVAPAGLGHGWETPDPSRQLLFAGRAGQAAALGGGTGFRPVVVPSSALDGRGYGAGPSAGLAGRPQGTAAPVEPFNRGQGPGRGYSRHGDGDGLPEVVSMDAFERQAQR